MPAVTVKHKVLFGRDHPDERFRPLATRAVDDANADEDFAALRIQKIIDANRAGAPRPEFGVGVQTANHPDGFSKDTPAAMTFEHFGPEGPIKD